MYLLFSILIGVYFTTLLVISWFTGRNATNKTYFAGNKNSNWLLVGFGMIGTTLSGLTFISLPGSVLNDSFSYLQICIGYLIGYAIIAFVLLPVYYKYNLDSIYTYLERRFGVIVCKTGASFFILSRTVGATARLYLVIIILRTFVFANLQIPFWVFAVVILIFIYLYTVRGGVKTIVWTDMLQTCFMIAGLIMCIVFILKLLHFSLVESMQHIQAMGFTKVFITDSASPKFFLKQIFAGVFITLGMTGLDQEFMQKNISVRTLKDSQKNIFFSSVMMIIVIILFLYLGALLYSFMLQQGAVIHVHELNNQSILFSNNQRIVGDQIFPEVAMHYLSPLLSLVFVIALISAVFPSADGAITSLTSSFCIDILGIQKRYEGNGQKQIAIRKRVHIMVSLSFFVLILLFHYINSSSMLALVLKLSTYTYGPLLGLFAFGILTKRSLTVRWVPYICVLSPIICLLIEYTQQYWLGGYRIGLELLVINGALTYTGLLLIAQKNI